VEIITIVTLTPAIVLLFAAVVWVLGTDKGYKVLFVVLALIYMWGTYRGRL
jgi:hypothetical protein